MKETVKIRVFFKENLPPAFLANTFHGSISLFKKYLQLLHQCTVCMLVIAKMDLSIHTACVTSVLSIH